MKKYFDAVKTEKFNRQFLWPVITKVIWRHQLTNVAQLSITQQYNLIEL